MAAVKITKEFGANKSYFLASFSSRKKILQILKGDFEALGP